MKMIVAMKKTHPLTPSRDSHRLQRTEYQDLGCLVISVLGAFFPPRHMYNNNSNNNNNNNNNDNNNNNNNNRIERRNSKLLTVSLTYAQVARAQSCANHVQHIEHLSRATCSVPLGTKGQLCY